MSKEVATTVERFQEYTLTGVLPETGKLTLDNKLNFVSLSVLVDGERKTVEQCGFPPLEYALLTTLLEHFPYYASYAYLLHACAGGSVEDCQQDIRDAEAAGDVKMATAPVVNLTSRVRIRLRPFGIDISSILQTGYILVARTRTFKRNRIH